MAESETAATLVTVCVAQFDNETELLDALRRRAAQNDRLWFRVEHACMLLARRWMRVYLFFSKHRRRLRPDVADHHVLWHSEAWEEVSSSDVVSSDVVSSDVVSSDDWERAIDCAVAGGYFDMAERLHRRWSAWMNTRRVQQRVGNE